MPDAPDRTEVYPHLWVGGGNAEVGFKGIVVDVREGQPQNPHAIHIPAFKGRGEGWTANPILAQKAVDLITSEIGRGSDVLVRCGSGVERSPAIVVLYLIRNKGLNPSAAYARVRSARPQVIEEFDLLPLTYEERTR
jgi:hypothetical protein